jgi:O-methyltransferase
MINLFFDSVSRFLNECRALIKYKKLHKKYGNYTMIFPYDYICCLELVAKFKDIPGPIVECGVWRGGMIAGIAEVLGKNRNYFLFDSFEGLPPAKEIDGGEALTWQQNTDSPNYRANCKAEMEWAEKAMKLAGAEKYQLIKGWFNDTLPTATFDEPISILRLDADWYDSTMCCLVNLYPKVIKGGIIIFDDYYTWEGCSKALHDYLSANKLADKIYELSTHSCYLVKTN